MSLHLWFKPSRCHHTKHLHQTSKEHAFGKDLASASSIDTFFSPSHVSSLPLFPLSKPTALMGTIPIIGPSSFLTAYRCPPYPPPVIAGQLLKREARVDKATHVAWPRQSQPTNTGVSMLDRKHVCAVSSPLMFTEQRLKSNARPNAIRVMYERRSFIMRRVSMHRQGFHVRAFDLRRRGICVVR